MRRLARLGLLRVWCRARKDCLEIEIGLRDSCFVLKNRLSYGQQSRTLLVPSNRRYLESNRGYMEGLGDVLVFSGLQGLGH